MQPYTGVSELRNTQNKGGTQIMPRDKNNPGSSGDTGGMKGKEKGEPKSGKGVFKITERPRGGGVEEVTPDQEQQEDVRREPQLTAEEFEKGILSTI